MGGRRRETYLIQDPHDLDALEFIRTIDICFGLRPVCLYTDPKARFYGERRFPILTSDRIERSVDVEWDDLGACARRIAEEYDVQGIVPYREDTIEVAADLLEPLELDWNLPATLRRFRDKHALASHVQKVAPSVRVPECRLVRDEGDLRAGDLPERFVVKPNDGFGNREIGIFGADDLEKAAAHVRRYPENTWCLQEFIDGTEYHVDGQMRTGGVFTPLGVSEYIRKHVNDYPTVYFGEVQCRSSHPLFSTLLEYAERLLAATGLERCPFHLEVKVDDRGPCVVDLGARLLSESGGKTLSRFHPSRPSAYAVAAHDYLFPNQMAMDPIDWTAYDASLTAVVYGVSHEVGLLETVSGLAEVEARPEFVKWILKPEVGDRLWATRDLRAAPFIVEFGRLESEEEARHLIDEVHDTISLNGDRTAWTGPRARLAEAMRRARGKIPWILHRMRRALW